MQIPTTFFGWVSFLWDKYWLDFLRGLGVTLELVVIGAILGCLIGFVVGIIRSITVDRGSSPISRSLMAAVKAVLAAYVEIFRGTPMMCRPPLSTTAPCPSGDWISPPSPLVLLCSP